MANVKQIKINDTVYDVEDSVARSALEQKAPLESPALTGIPTAPTASNGTNTTQVATTAFVQNAVQGSGSSYTLPVASSTTLGGVKPVAKTASMTQEVGVDASGALYTEPGSGGGGTVTESDIENALGYKPIGAADVPVKKVNGATGEVKSTFYVTVTQGDNNTATADKTAAEVYAAYEAGYAVYAIVKFSAVDMNLELPLVLATPFFGTFVLGFSALGSQNPTENPQYPTVAYTGMEWMAWIGTLARESDIPTELKNPYSLNIKIGNATTSYDGSVEKTVEIPEGGGTDKSLGITGAAAGEFPKVSAVNENGVPTSWEPVEGEEVTLGGDVPAPTDAQVNTAVNAWLTEHPEATTTVQDGAVTVKKLGYGKHIYGSKPYFCGAVGTGAQVYGSLGVVVPCKAGDTIYTTITVPTNTSWNVPKILTAFPENQYGDIASITLENLAVNNDTKQYAIGADKTTAKALYIPQNFLPIPAANNGSVEDALAWINKTMGTDGRWCAQNVPFEDYDAWYQTAQTELFDIDESCNKLMYASLYQAVSKLVGAKVAVLGDSLTEQSACSFINSA